MSLTYLRTWEVMNQLEESFNRISALEYLIDDLNEAVKSNDQDSIADISKALSSYMPVYTRQYEKTFKNAWNNTVIEVKKYDDPYKLTHEELETFFKDVATTDEYELK